MLEKSHFLFDFSWGVPQQKLLHNINFAAHSRSPVYVMETLGICRANHYLSFVVEVDASRPPT
jgi:hypothetical protein